MPDSYPPPAGDPVDGPAVPAADLPSVPPAPVPPGPSYDDVPVPPGPSYAAAAVPSAGSDVPPLGAPELLASGTVLPAAEPPRRSVSGRTVVAAALGVLLVLLAGGAAYGWSFLNRADVKLARAFDATRSSAGDLTVTVEGTGEPSPSVRYAWTTDGTVQVQVSPAGKPVALDVISTGTHVVLRLDASAVPEGGVALDQLRTIADTLGPDGAALTALADGKPVGLAIGRGSRFQKLLDEAGATASASPDTAALQEQVAALVDSVGQAVKDNVTVASAGSDQYGDRSTLTLPLKPVVAQAMESLKKAVPALGGSAASMDLSDLGAKTVQADVWTNDGRVTRIAVPLAQLGDGGPGTLVVVLGTTGVQQPAGQVTEISDGLLDKMLGGLPALGGSGITG